MQKWNSVQLLIYNGLGSLFLNQEHYDKAKAEFEKALAFNPNDAETHNWLGRVAGAQERYEDAEKAFLRVIELSPEEPNYHYNLGLTLQNL